MTDQATCIWTEDENGIYQTECWNAFELNDGTPADNGMVYCCYCGNLIKENLYEEMYDAP